MSIASVLTGIPTDSLYKFLAIFGLVLILASNTLFFIAGSSLENYGTNLLQTAATSTYERGTVNNDIAMANNKQNEFEGELGSSAIQNKQYILQEIEMEQNIITNDNNKVEELNNNIIKFNESKELVTWLNVEKEYLILVFIWGNAFGFLISLGGFCFWYTRFQKYQDVIVKHNSQHYNEKLASIH